MRRTILLTRDTTESVSITVTGHSAEDCERKALAMAMVDQPDLTWEVDEGNAPQPAYVTGNDEADDVPEPPLTLTFQGRQFAVLPVETGYKVMYLNVTCNIAGSVSATDPERLLKLLKARAVCCRTDNGEDHLENRS